MKEFGYNPYFDDLEHAETPVGRPCLYCQELIAEGDVGVLTHFLRSWDPPLSTEEPVHLECHMRQTLGSVAHQEERCHCFVPGSKEDDPAGLTKREAAKLAVEVFRRRGEI